jgi:hypothetical protein
MFKKPYKDDGSAPPPNTKKKVAVWSMRDPEKKKLQKFDFEKMKSEALSPDLAVRKAAFLEYFERFAEFPSYLFDNEQKIDECFLATILEIEKDPEMTKPVLQGITALRIRLSF